MTNAEKLQKINLHASRVNTIETIRRMGVSANALRKSYCSLFGLGDLTAEQTAEHANFTLDDMHRLYNSMERKPQ